MRETRQSRRCQCWLEKIKAQRLAEIPDRFRDIATGKLRLAQLQAKGPRQEFALRSLRSDHHQNCLFWGPTGSGKTFLGYLLYRQAVEENRVVTAISTLELIQQYRKEIERRGKEPDGAWSPKITPERLKTADRKHFILLDEFTNVNVTTFVSERVFELVDAIYQNGHQVVITSQYPPDEVRQIWSRADPSFGEAIARRVIAMCASFGL